MSSGKRLWIIRIVPDVESSPRKHFCRFSGISLQSLSVFTGNRFLRSTHVVTGCNKNADMHPSMFHSDRPTAPVPKPSNQTMNENVPAFLCAGTFSFTAYTKSPRFLNLHRCEDLLAGSHGVNCILDELLKRNPHHFRSARYHLS